MQKWTILHLVLGAYLLVFSQIAITELIISDIHVIKLFIINNINIYSVIIIISIAIIFIIIIIIS